MYRIDSLAEKAVTLASQVGDGLKTALPGNAGKWLQTGVALGAAKTGTRVATHLVRRNPGMVAAAAAAGGILWFLARRQQKKSEGQAIEGRSTRVEARRASGAPRKRAASKRSPRTRSTSSSTSSSDD